MNSQPKPDSKPTSGAMPAVQPQHFRARVPVLEGDSLSWPTPIEVQLWRP